MEPYPERNLYFKPRCAGDSEFSQCCGGLYHLAIARSNPVQAASDSRPQDWLDGSILRRYLVS